jgi:hypothetical protein
MGCCDSRVALLLVLFYTAAHPGSLLPTQNCDYYLPLQNIELHPQFDKDDDGKAMGEVVGFDVMIKLDRWKGYQSTKEKQVR